MSIFLQGLTMILGFAIGWYIVGPMMAGFKPFTSSRDAVYEPEKHRLWKK